MLPYSGREEHVLPALVTCPTSRGSDTELPLRRGTPSSVNAIVCFTSWSHSYAVLKFLNWRLSVPRALSPPAMGSGWRWVGKN